MIGPIPRCTFRFYTILRPLPASKWLHPVRAVVVVDKRKSKSVRWLISTHRAACFQEHFSFNAPPLSFRLRPVFCVPGCRCHSTIRPEKPPQARLSPRFTFAFKGNKNKIPKKCHPFEIAAIFITSIQYFCVKWSGAIKINVSQMGS